MERKRRKVSEDLVANSWFEKLNTLVRVICFESSLSGFSGLTYFAFYCAVTCNRGTGRLLAAHPPMQVQVLHELPQDVQRWTTTTRSRFKINTTTILLWTITSINEKLESDYYDVTIQIDQQNPSGTSTTSIPRSRSSRKRSLRLSS